MLRFVSRKAFVIPTVALAVLAMLPSISNAGTKAGDWVLELGGNGANNKEFNTGAVGGAASLGYFITDQLEASFNQQLGFAFNHMVNRGDTITGDSQVALDWNFPLGNWVPFVGANIGLSYGDNGVKTLWEVGPEGGLKFFINQTTYVYLEAQWDFAFASHELGTSEFLYSLGLGVKL